MPASYSLGPKIEGEVAACSGTFGCLEALAGSLVGFVLWTGLATGLLFAPRTNVRAALEALRVEYEAIVAEQDALEAFVSRVEGLSPSGSKSAVEAGGVGVVGAATGHAGGMEQVRTAYRETVMDVPHYERDYGESFPVNIANEFGGGVAGAVLANDTLSPQVKRAVIASARDGVRGRDSYLDTLERERERLDEAGTALEDAAARCDAVDGRRLRRRPFDDLQRRYERLESARESLASTLDRRQEQVQDGVAFGWQRRDSEPVHRYLYEDIDATYPVLADGTRLLERIDDVESRLTTALTARV